jgi:hypothetical protein
VAVLKEFFCNAHGPFEEMVEQDVTPNCPHGCSPRFVMREIRSAPKARNVVTGTLDGLQRGIAEDFNLPDIRVGKDDGKSVMQNLKSADFSPKWVDVPSKAKSASEMISSFGMTGGNALTGHNIPKPQPQVRRRTQSAAA